VRLIASGAAALIALGGWTATAGAPPDVVASLRAYVAGFARDARFVIAREHYTQEVRSRRGSYGATAGVIVGSRTSEAEVAFASITDGMWLMTRQVSSVDGRAVPASPLPKLEEVHGEREAVDLMKRMANDAAKWNIGGIVRNINTPTLALWFLTDPVVSRFRLRESGRQDTAAGSAHVIRFTETAQPPVMQANHVPAPASGRVWALDSGAVVKTELTLQSTAHAAPATSASIVVNYTYSPVVKFWVPATMTEIYETAGLEGERITATATYSDYRLFTVDVRIK